MSACTVEKSHELFGRQRRHFPPARSRHEFIHTLPGALALGARIGTPNVGLLMDTWHLFTVLDEVGFDGPTLVEPFNAEVRALPPEERVAAVAASLESVWP